MRLPYPERLPMDRVAVYALLLFIAQLLEGTELYFAIGTLVFIVVAALAFNLGGGLRRAAGVYVFFYAVLDFVIGVSYKAVLGEPAQSNLLDPKTTIWVYVGGISGIFAAVLISRFISRRTGLLETMLREDRMYRSCIGCIVFGIGGPALIGLLGASAAKVESAFTQLNELLPLAIITGTLYEVRRSAGTRSMNLPVLFAILYTFTIYGLLGFSKQAMLLPLYCWGVAACAMRLRLSTLQIASLGLWVWFVFWFLVPFSQSGKRYLTSTSSMQDRIAIAQRLAAHPVQLRSDYEQSQRDSPDPNRYYNQGQGFWDRLTFIAADDRLINITDNGHVFGYLPITASFLNAVPHFILPNKVTYNFGNIYAHEFGELSAEDTTTGISFSPSSELFHIGRWTALLIVGPLIWTLLFVVFDLLCGDLRKTPWGLLVIAMLSHAAPETGVEGCIYMATFGSEILIFCAIFATYAAPAIANAVIGNVREAGPRLGPRVPTPASALSMRSQQGTVWSAE